MSMKSQVHHYNSIHKNTMKSKFIVNECGFSTYNNEIKIQYIR